MILQSDHELIAVCVCLSSFPFMDFSNNHCFRFFRNAGGVNILELGLMCGSPKNSNWIVRYESMVEN